MNMKQAAQFALDAQHACNLSAVVHTASQILTEVLWAHVERYNAQVREIGQALPEEPIFLGTDWVNQHPISVLFAAAISHLAKSGAELAYSRAYEECVRLAEPWLPLCQRVAEEPGERRGEINHA